jgi:FMN-dependent NADH-azoreductase
MAVWIRAGGYPVVPAFSEFLPPHRASLADSHEQARKLAETFQAAL